MKKVKMNISIASANWSYIPGQIVELEDDIAIAWNECGHCTIVEEQEGTHEGTLEEKEIKPKTTNEKNGGKNVDNHK